MFLVLGITGGIAAVAPSASAAPCQLVRIDVVVFGTHVTLTGAETVCI